MSEEIDIKYFKLFPSDGEYKPLSKEDSLARAKNSLLEAWFDTMKVSPWYRAMLGGYDRFLENQTPHERRIALDNLKVFGDIRNQTFATWWMHRGFYVFSERVPYMPMRAVSVKYPQGKLSKIEEQLEDSPEAFLTIEVPLNLDRGALHSQLDEILNEIDRYEGGFKRWKYSTAELHLTREERRGFGAQQIKAKLDVYEYYEKQLKKDCEYSLYQLCDELKIPTGLTEADFENLDQDAIDQRKRDVVSEILKSAKNLMANALFRDFPDVNSHPLATHFAFSEFENYVDRVTEEKFDSNVSRRNKKKREAEAAAQKLRGN